MLKSLLHFIKLVIAWIGTGLMIVVFAVYFPHWSSWLMMLFILGIVPIKQIQNVWGKLRITGALKVFVLVVLFFVSILSTPGSSDGSERLEPTETATAFSETEYNEEPETTVKVEIAPETTAPETLETTVATEAITEETEPQETLSVEQLAIMVEAIVSRGFENYNVKTGEDLISVEVCSDGLSYLATMASAGDQTSISSWEDVVDMTITSSEELTKFIQGSDNPQVYISFSVLNDQNTSNVLISCLNGILVYDVVSGVDLLG